MIISIRQVSLKDREQIIKVLKEYDHPKISDKAVELLTSPKHLERVSKVGLSFVAEDIDKDVEIVGFVNGYICKDDSLLISDLVVKKNYRGHGIAKQLILKQREEALTRGIKVMWGTVVDDNESAIKLYRNLGFNLKKVMPSVGGFPGMIKFTYKIL
jgi:ribosomal protein S18 acetylase RimI-like enzyme